MKPRRSPWGKLFLAAALLIAAVSSVWWIYTRTSVSYRLDSLRAELDSQTRLGAGKAERLLLFEKILALDPRDLQVVLELSRLYQHFDRSSEAEALLWTYHLRYQGSLRLRLALAWLLYEEGRQGEAGSLVLSRLEEIEAHTDVAARADAMILVGRLLAAKGEWEPALELIQRAVDLREAHGLRAQHSGDERSAGLLALGEVLAASGRFLEAQRALSLAVEAAPNGVKSRIALGRVLVHNGELQQAEETLLEFYERGGELRLQVIPTLAVSLVGAERLVRARELEARLIDEGAPGMAAYVRGLVLDHEGDLRGARGAFEEMQSRLPDSIEARMMLARTALREGDPEAARAALESVLEISPNSIEAELSLLELEEQSGDLELARSRAVRLLARPFARSHAMRVVLALAGLGDLGVVGVAAEALNQRLELSPNDTSLELYSGLLQLVAGETEAGAVTLAALAEQPDVDLREGLGLLGEVGDLATARPLVECVVVLAEENPGLAPVRLLLAAIYQRLGRGDLARGEIDAALAAKPGWRPALLERARSASASGDHEQAVADLEALYQVSLGDVALVEALATTHLRQGDPERAIAYLQRAVSLLPESGGALARLARAQALAGQVRAALTTFEDAQRAEPREPLAYQEGAIHLLRGDVVSAERSFERAARLTGEDAYFAARAAALGLLDRPGEALAPLQRWLAGRHSPAGALIMTLLLEQAGDASRAAEAARVSIRGGVPPGVVAAARALSAGKAKWALKTFALTALGWIPGLRGWQADAGDDPLALWWLFQAETDASRRLELAGRLSEVAPSAETSLLLASAQLAAGDQSAELELLRDLAGRYPDDPDVSLRFAMSLERAGHVDEAVGRYSLIVSSAERPPPVALNNLAVLLGSDPARRALGLDYARAAVRDMPGVAAAHDTLGWLLCLDGQPHEAVARLRRAVALEPGRAAYRFHLASALEQLGRLGQALSQVETALLAGGADSEGEASALKERVTLSLEAAQAVARPLSIGRAETGLLQPEALEAFELRAVGVERLGRLRCVAPAGSLLSIDLGHGHWKRVQLSEQGTVELSGLRIPAEGMRLVLRSSAPGPYEVKLDVIDPVPGQALEPDERLELANQIAPGQELSGAFGGLGDVDHVALKLGGPGDLELEAGAEALRAEVLVVRGGVSHTASVVPVGAGQRAVLRSLATRGGDRLVLRLVAAAGVVATAGPSAATWRLRLSEGTAAADAEPNDHPRDARALEGSAAGSLGPVDPADWFRLSGGAGQVWALELKGEPEASLQLEAWLRPTAGHGISFWGRAGPRSDGLASFSRWRVPPGSELFLRVRSGHPLLGPASYQLSARLAAGPSGRETEPNDDRAEAEDVPAGSWEGAIDSQGDRDWLRPQPSDVVELTLSGGADTLRVYDLVGGRPQLRLELSAGLEGLTVPALKLASDPLLELSSVGRVGSYTLILRPVQPPEGTEVEPNDALDQALAASVGSNVSGHLSGLSDRDMLWLGAGARRVEVSAVGGPVSVGVLGDPSTVRVEPGTSRTLDVQGGSLLELRPPIADPTAGARYTVRVD